MCFTLHVLHVLPDTLKRKRIDIKCLIIKPVVVQSEPSPFGS